MSAPVRAYGLSHVALKVGDPEQSFRFHEAVFGMVAICRDAGFVQAQTPGTRDVLVFERGDFIPGEPYLFAFDPDGYEVEVWYELPTPADPA